ncbi:MAG: cohesin domain-containing protein [Candidatus Falkowbacteria bacterium]|nr:cohesin domain-containing protein [Candidatus Falkowbacteria bacterium]
MAEIVVKPTSKYQLNRRLVLSVGLAFIFSVFLALPATALAASLYFSPSAGAYEVGKTFSVSVYVSSADQAMNAASGAISFPKDKLEITALSKSGSIFSLWVQEPVFSNSTGVINFEGIVLNPGFSGSGGKIMTINFKVKAAGQAGLNFSSGSILANDGAGTNILKSLGSASYKLSAAASPGTPVGQVTEAKPAVAGEVPAPAAPPAIAGVPAAPQILSSTHPDPNAWYNNNNPKFTWKVPAGITTVRVLYDKYPVSNPTVVYQPPISGKDLVGLSDGTYYFHAQFRNAKGWGAVSHFRFQIDTVPPVAFTVKFPSQQNTNDPRPVVLFDTTDELSGIDYYEIKAGDGQAFKVTPGEIVGSNPYVLPVQKPGQHSIIVKAVDKAGNSATASEIFSVTALDAPVLDYYPNDLTEGDVLKVPGKTYPESNVTIFVRDELGLVSSDTIISNSQGNFTMIWSKRLLVGTYSLWAQVTNVDGAKSAITTPSTFVVRQPVLDKIANLVLNYLSVFMLLVFFILGLIFFAWYGWHKFLLLKKKIKKEAKGVEKDFLDIFDHLQQDIEQQIRLIEKAKNRRELTTEEKRIITILRRDLAVAKKVLSEEMKNIATK